MPHKELTVEEVMALLASAPARLTEVTRGLTEAQLHAAPAPDEWSANDVLAHLRACADRWGGHMTAMIAEDAPTLRAINPRTWIKQTDYLELEFRPSLRAFVRQRDELLATLRQLPPRGWLRTVTIKGAGKPLHLDVISYGRRLAEHERPHIKQIARVADTLRG